MQATLADIGCKTSLSHEKHPLAHCYSVNLTSMNAPHHIYANGKGCNAQAAMASALGEYIERLQTNNFFSDFHLPDRTHFPDEVAFDFNEPYLSPELLSLYDPNTEIRTTDLVDFNSDCTDKIVTLPFIKQSSGEVIYFPINILNNLYVSNGLASGNTPYEAKVQALSEIFERFVKIEIIKKGYALPKYPDTIVESFPALLADLTALRQRGYIVDVLDASLGGQYPVTAISLINPQNSSLFVSFGAHPILEVALERTMTELMQGRELDDLNGFETPTFDMDFVADSFNLESHFIDSNGKLGFEFLSNNTRFKFSSWHYSGSSCQNEYATLTTIITHLNKEIFLREYEYLGFYTCQMIVPQLSEIYPITDLIDNNRNQGKWIRDLVLHFTEYDPHYILEQIHHLGDELQVDQHIGVIFKHRFTMLEFKAQMYLLLHQNEDVLTTLDFSESKMALIICELIRMTQQGLSFNNHKDGLSQIFGQSEVERAWRIIKGQELLINITLHQDYTNMLSLYDTLHLKKQQIQTYNETT